MRVSAVIAEYNPFHNGHKYHLETTKKLTDDSFVMVIMSGNFVQRGEPAIMYKRDRVRAALMNGADLVVELPLPWATASAERFAKGAAYIAAQCGVVDTLSFGCETDNADILSKIAKVSTDKVYSAEIKKYYDMHLCSYPEARSAVIKQVLGQKGADVLTKPNNILAVEYIKALKTFKSDIKPLCVGRMFGKHDGDRVDESFTSAMNIRNMIKTGKEFLPFVPENTYDIFEAAGKNGTYPSLYSNLETAMLAHLRKMQPKDFLKVPDVAEGIENRICDAVKTSVGLDEIFDKVKTKRYTHSRIRRIILTSFLGITTDDVTSFPPYMRVLGFNDNGRKILKEIRSKYFYPMIMKYSDVQYLDSFAKHVFQLESTATDIYNLSVPKRNVCCTEMTDEIIYIP